MTILWDLIFIVAVLWIIATAVRRRKKPLTATARPGNGDHGVDLSQYQPELPAAEPVAAPPAVQEGGPDHA